MNPKQSPLSMEMMEKSSLKKTLLMEVETEWLLKSTERPATNKDRVVWETHRLGMVTTNILIWEILRLDTLKAATTIQKQEILKPKLLLTTLGHNKSGLQIMSPEHQAYNRTLELLLMEELLEVTLQSCMTKPR